MTIEFKIQIDGGNSVVVPAASIHPSGSVLGPSFTVAGGSPDPHPGGGGPDPHVGGGGPDPHVGGGGPDPHVGGGGPLAAGTVLVIGPIVICGTDKRG